MAGDAEQAWFTADATGYALLELKRDESDEGEPSVFSDHAAVIKAFTHRLQVLREVSQRASGAHAMAVSRNNIHGAALAMKMPTHVVGRVVYALTQHDPVRGLRPWRKGAAQPELLPAEAV